MKADEIESKMTKLGDQETAIKTAMEQNKIELSSYPDPGSVKRFPDLGRKITASMPKNPESILSKPYKNKRALMQLVLLVQRTAEGKGLEYTLIRPEIKINPGKLKLGVYWKLLFLVTSIR